MSAASVATASTSARSLLTNMLHALGGMLRHVRSSVASTPIYFWIYIGALLYITRRLTYTMGKSSRRCTVGGKVVLLSSAEEGMTANVVDTTRIDAGFDTVGGLDEVKQALTEHVMWPFQRPELFRGNTIRSHPKGILLYGPPGTGKTLLARALAKELGCAFINVKTETIMSKWVGDTEKNSAAVFSLAQKIAPCVIFIDEIDALLSTRQAQDTTPHINAKTIFMTQWDGLEQDANSQVIVVGATNRRRSIDDAIRRRLPLQLEVPPPDLKSREKILSIVLAQDLEGNPQKNGLIQYVALKTTNYTGSDLTELCKAAALMPLRELASLENSAQANVPPLNKHHFDEALKRVLPSS